MRPAEGSLAAARTQGLAKILGATGGRARRVLLVTVGTLTLATGAIVPVALSTSGAGASSVTTLQQRASALASQIQTDYAKLDVLDEGYDQAEGRVHSLEKAVGRAETEISQAEKRLSTDKAHLRTVAIDAYVEGGSGGGLASLVSSDSKNAPMRQAYLQAASGSLNGAEATVTTAEHNLSDHKTTLERAEQGAKKAETRISSERRLAQRITDELESQLSQVKGRIAQAVDAAERQKQLQEQAAAQAAELARQQQIARQTSAESTPSGSSYTPPSVGGGSGGVAVHAAESQLGVPYVWGGATPGVGFDCSGLTMWSWEQAGVSLAHGATDQYYEIAHVSMANLRPGDLIFYGDSSYLYHVVMYVGSGPYGADTVIQAQQTGTNVMFTPIPGGAYGAGQP